MKRVARCRRREQRSPPEERLEKLLHRFERARQVLFVTVQITQNLATCAAEAAIDGVIHALVLFDKCFDPLVTREPLQRPIVGTGILHNVFGFDLLIGYRSDA